MQRNRANQIGLKVRIVSNDLDEFKGLRPFHERRFGTITGFEYREKSIYLYIIATGTGEQRLARTQFATSAITKSYKYKGKKK